jgi:hypothetical protein
MHGRPIPIKTYSDPYCLKFEQKILYSFRIAFKYFHDYRLIKQLLCLRHKGIRLHNVKIEFDFIATDFINKFIQ